MITPIDVIDSAVKIGLGATISGFATYWLAKANHYKTLEKERAQRKRELLEIVAEQVATFDQRTLAHWEKVVNWLAFTPEGESMSSDLKNELTRLHDGIRSTFNELKSAETKLLLLGELNCQKLLRDYTDFVRIYRQESIEARIYKVSDLTEYKNTLRQKREKFLNELSAVYTST